jgi:hypothetical protein
MVFTQWIIIGFAMCLGFIGQKISYPALGIAEYWWIGPFIIACLIYLGEVRTTKLKNKISELESQLRSPSNSVYVSNSKNSNKFELGQRTKVRDISENGKGENKIRNLEHLINKPTMK